MRTPFRIVSAMLEFAQVTSNDLCIDLGCGDARFLTSTSLCCHATHAVARTVLSMSGPLFSLARRTASASMNRCAHVRDTSAEDFVGTAHRPKHGLRAMEGF